jgi:SNF2 family DNA or RNA helicase
VTTGIDLVGFDAVILVGLDWLPSKLLQGEARVHRQGQARAVAIWYLIGLETVDEVVRERVLDRLDMWEEILGKESTGMSNDLGGGTADEILGSLIARIQKENRK